MTMNPQTTLSTLGQIPPQTPGLEYYKKRTHVSITSLTACARCPLKFFFSSGCRLEPTRPAPWFPFGEAIHGALPHALLGDMERAIEVFDFVWDSTQEDAKHSKGLALLMLNDAVAHYRTAWWEIAEPPQGKQDLGPRVNEYEVPWAVDLGLDVPLVGRTDWMCYTPADDELCPNELKTASQMGPSFFHGFKRNPQIIANVIAAKLMGCKCSKAVLTVMRKSTRRTETVSQPIGVTDLAIEQFIKWARETTINLLAAEEAGIFQPKISACTSYPEFGNAGFPCDFDQLCDFRDWTQAKQYYNIGGDKTFELHKLRVMKVEELSK